MSPRDCRSVQAAIPDWLNGTHADIRPAELRRHLDRCPDCAAAAAEWRSLAGVLEAAQPPAVAPSLQRALAKVDRTMPGGPDAAIATRPAWQRATLAGAALTLLIGLAWSRVPEASPRPTDRTPDHLAAVDARTDAVPPAARAGRHLPAQRPDGGGVAAPPVGETVASRSMAARTDPRAGSAAAARADDRAEPGAASHGPTATPEPAPPTVAEDAPREQPREAPSGGSGNPSIGGGSPQPSTPEATVAAPTATTPPIEPVTYALIGTVEDDLGRPLPGAFLQIWAEPSGSAGPLAYLTESDAGGRFSLALPAGVYLVHGEAPGHEAAWLGGADRAGALRLNLPAPADAPAARLVLRRLSTATPAPLTTAPTPVITITATVTATVSTDPGPTVNASPSAAPAIAEPRGGFLDPAAHARAGGRAPGGG